jgi:poly(A) polymerase
MGSDQIKNLRDWVVGHYQLKILLTISKEIGVDIFLVGGLVRDWLLGQETQDVDLTLSREALTIARLFADRTGGTFVLLREEGEMARVITKGRTFDFSNFRGPDLEADLKGRDFTINTICLSLSRAFVPGEWIPYDPLKGIRDLEDKLLRMSNPDCFQQDPLRMLRAFRFSAQLGLTIDSETSQAITKNAPALIRSAPERIHYEWLLLLSQSNSFISILAMEEAGLLEVLFPEMGPIKGIRQDRYHHLDVFQHSLLTFQFMEKLTQRHISIPADLEAEVISFLKQKKNLACLKWAALVHDLGKATTGKEKKGHLTFYGHAEVSQRLFNPIAERYRLSNREKTFIQKIIDGHMRPLYLVNEESRGHLAPRALNRFVREASDELSGFFLLALADSLAAQGSQKPKDLEDRIMNLWRKALLIRDEWIRPQAKNPPLISGNDLIELGLKPGPLFKTLLSKINEEQLEGTVQSREEALDWIKKGIGPS